MKDQPRTAETIIGGFEVSFEYDPSLLEEGGATQCFVIGKGLSGSLALLEGTGCLTDRNMDDKQIPEDTARKIVAWAYAQGY